jgi:hypothetical protein
MFETQINGGEAECCEALINGVPLVTPIPLKSMLADIITRLSITKLPQFY